MYIFHFHSKVEIYLGSKNLVISLCMTTFIQDWLFSKFYELILEDEIFIILIPITVSLLAVPILTDRNRAVLCIFDMLWYSTDELSYCGLFPCTQTSILLFHLRKCLLFKITILTVFVVPEFSVQSNWSLINYAVVIVGRLETWQGWSQWLHHHSKNLHLSYFISRNRS